MLIVFLISLSILSLSYFLIHKKEISAVFTSSLITVFAYFFLRILHMSFEFNSVFLMEVIFGASFVGMTSFKYKPIFFVLFNSLIFSFLYTFIFNLLPISGGALGLTAFLTVSTFKIFTKLKFFHFSFKSFDS